MGYFQREGQENILLLCKGGGSLHVKIIIKRGCVLSTQPDLQKRPQCKKKAQKK